MKQRRVSPALISYLTRLTAISLLWLEAAGFAQSPAPSASPASPGKATPASNSGDNYKPGPDSLPQPGVIPGKHFIFKLAESRIFPGTSRSVTVYVPAEYKGDKPACVFVGLDWLGFRAPVVFDNLIARKEMPITIGIGIPASQVDSTSPPADPRFERSFEFDSLNVRLARYLIEEVLPQVEKQKTPDGLPIILSQDPDDRAIGGASTGGIGAFNVAWERPDAFRRVFTAIGTFVGMRGGDRLPVLIRKTEPKPLRVFMQDGSNDEWPGGPEMGDWWMSNQTVERALQFAGYPVQHAWGAGSHNGSHADAVFPDAMRWLWKDWPQPVEAGAPGNPVLKAILLPGDNWQAVTDGTGAISSLTCDPQGTIYCGDAVSGKICKIGDDGKMTDAGLQGLPGTGMAFGRDMRLYVADAGSDGKILALGTNGQASTVAEGIRGRSLTVAANGNIYVIEGDDDAGKIWLIKPDGEKSVVDTGVKGPGGIALSPDGLWLFVGESRTHFGMSYRVQPDGTLQYREPFYDFYVPDWANDSGVGGICMDRDGRPYAATRMGVQVFDRNGRVTAILPLPANEEATSVCFGGRAFDTLYVIAEGRIYKRKMKAQGAPSWLAPFKLPPWGAG